MLDYSKAAIGLILEDIKKWCNRFKIIFSAFTLTYLAYCITMRVGVFYINISLLVLYLIYTLYEIVTYKRNNKKAKKAVTQTYKRAVLLLKTFTLASTLYGIYIASTTVDGISLIFATLTIIVWIMQLLLELLIIVAEPKVKLLTAGFMEDLKFIANIHNIFSRKENDWSFDSTEYQKEYNILEEKIIHDKSSKRIAKKIAKKRAKRALLAIGSKKENTDK